MSFNNTAFNNNTVGPNGAATRHSTARTTLLAQADAILRQGPGPVQGVQGLAAPAGVTAGAATFPSPLAYEEIPIFNAVIANYLSQIFAFASVEIARAADFPIRMPGNSPYDSPRTPLVARRGHVSAANILSQRPSYLKAIIIHTRGNLNFQPCQRCLAAYNRTGEFLHYAGCISLFSWYNGACSNCIHDDHGATCSIKGNDNRKLSYDDYNNELNRDRSRSPDDDNNKGKVKGKGRLGSLREEGRRRQIGA